MCFGFGCVTQDVLFEIVAFEQDISQGRITLRSFIRTVVIDESASTRVDSGRDRIPADLIVGRFP